MDRRSLLFILLVSLSFFGIRTWYEKRYEERVANWKSGEALIQHNPETMRNLSHFDNEEPPALFDLPLVNTVEKREAILETSTDLLDSLVVDTLSQAARPNKSAYGLEIGADMFALLSQQMDVEWPKKIEIQYIKNQNLTHSTPLMLIESFGPSYAIYAPQERKEEAFAQIGTLSEEHLIYAIHPLDTNFSDPENYQLSTLQLKNGKLFDLNNTPFTATNALLFSGRSSIGYLPLGTISQYSQDTISLFSEKSFIQKNSLLTTSNPSSPAPKYYLLENKYQQLVFSTENGSLVEVNLPFYSPQNPKSIVKPTSFDAAIGQASEKNALFPIHKNVLTHDNTFVDSHKGGYYPLLRRSLISDDAENTIIAQVLPQFESLQMLQATHGKYSIDSIQYTLKSHTETAISFRGVDSKGREIVKTYSFPKHQDSYPYCIDLDISIVKGFIGHNEIAVTTGVPEIEWMSGANGASLGTLLSKNNGSYEEKIFQRIDLPKDIYLSKAQAPHWIMNSNGFFAFIMKPISETFKGVLFEKAIGSDAPSRLVEIDAKRSQFTEEDLPGYQAACLLNNAKNHTIRLYAGPLDNNLLSTIDHSSQKEFGSSFESQKALTYQGWFAFISEPFAKLLYFFMKQFHAYVGSWGFSIVFATVILRVLLYPLNSWSMKSMKKMQEISPIAQALQEKYKKDPTRLQKEMLSLYKEKGVNPFSGCLPLLIQMPFLIGMFDLLKSTFALRGASFIPGWINDLSAPDVLFHLPIRLPLIGNEFHLLPILLGIIMWFQQNLSSNLPKNQADWTDQQRQQRAMGVIMTVVMTVMFYNFPSGLNIYWTSSILLGIVQQWRISRGKSLK